MQIESLDEISKQTVVYSKTLPDSKDRKDIIFLNTILSIHQPLVEIGVLNLESTAKQVREKLKFAEKKKDLSKKKRDSLSMVVHSKDAPKLIQCLVQSVDHAVRPFLIKILSQSGSSEVSEITFFTVKKKSTLSGEEFDLTVITLNTQEKKRFYGERHSYTGIQISKNKNNHCVICL